MLIKIKFKYNVMKVKSMYNLNLKRANDGGNLVFEITERNSGAVD